MTHFAGIRPFRSDDTRSYETARAFLEQRMRLQPLCSEETLNRLLSEIGRRCDLDWSQVEAFVQAVDAIIEEHGEFADPQPHLSGDSMLLDPEQFFWIAKFGALVLSGALGARLSFESSESEDSGILSPFLDNLGRLACDARKAGLNQMALKVLDLSNCLSASDDQGRLRAIMRVILDNNQRDADSGSRA